MSVQTRVIWNLPMPQESLDQIIAKWQELEADGKQAAPAVITEGPTQSTVDRFWVDEPTALYWISFVETFNPVSASIIN